MNIGPDEAKIAQSYKREPWQIRTKAHYKIWFSNKPHEFLNDENKLRFIRFCLENPEANFSFVYSSAILTEFAVNDLKSFCKNLNIQPIDFDVDVLSVLEHKFDEICYNFAKNEILHAVNKKGGNLAAASDLIRWIPGLIERCGIYSDFDVEVKFQKLAPVLPVKSAVILPTTFEVDEIGLNAYTINNEFLAFAYHMNRPDCLDKDTINIIRDTQAEMIKRYLDPISAILAPVIPGFQNPNSRNTPVKIILNWFNLHRKNASLFELRYFIEHLDFTALCNTLYYKVLPRIFEGADANDFAENEICQKVGQYRRKQIDTKFPGKMNHLKDEQIAVQFLDKLKSELYKASVECISGPFVSMAVLKSRLQSFDFSDSVFSHPIESQQLFINAMSNSSLNANELAECVFGQDYNEQHGNVMGDESWTETGGLQSQNRSEVICQAVVVIQTATRHMLEKKRISV